MTEYKFISDTKKVKYTDDELIAYMKQFRKANDQLPTVQKIADHFGVFVNGVQQKIERLERDGIFARNELNNIMFSRKRRRKDD